MIPSPTMLRGNISQAESWPVPSEITSPSDSSQRSLSRNASPDSKPRTNASLDSKPRSILRTPSGRSDHSSSKSVGVDSSLSQSSSGRASVGDLKVAGVKANEIQAQIDQLQKVNRALEPHIEHYKKMAAKADSFSSKQDALKEMKARREQFIARQK